LESARPVAGLALMRLLKRAYPEPHRRVSVSVVV
jgi:hypothetical protein